MSKIATLYLQAKQISEVGKPIQQLCGNQTGSFWTRQ